MGQGMIAEIEAIYENGVLRPLGPLSLSEKQKVTLTIASEAESLDNALFALSPERWDAFCSALDAPAKVVPALRKLLTEPSVFDGSDPAP
jgi:predicted DNA-binding antitoxin AbrB/MazE fold protein